MAVQGPSTREAGSAVKAVDGDNSTTNDGRTCAHTTEGTKESPAWWQVDLGDTYRITGIRIINRDRSCKCCAVFIL